PPAWHRGAPLRKSRPFRFGGWPVVALLVLLATAPVPGLAHARAPRPSVPSCALGTSSADLRGFYSSELARAERRFAPGRARARRQFSTAAAAYVYGLAPVAVHGTVQRFPPNQLVSIGALVDPAVRTVVLPNHDTTY